jgi:tetratricopeptide (TPR) repeat protein
MENAASRGVGLVVGAALILCVSACRTSSDQHGTEAASARAGSEPDPCRKGESVDPPRAEMEPAKVAFEARKYQRAIELFDDMAKTYPYSATVRVWRAEATLYRFKLSDGKPQYVQAASDALPFYRAAEKLHERGCRLPDEAQYYLRMGAAYAHLRKGDAKAAVAQLENARKEFPDSAEATYALARASCLLNAVDACAEHFADTLRIARELRRPIFLRTHRSMDEWIRRSQTQTELEPLRDDPRYAKIVREARAAE